MHSNRMALKSALTQFGKTLKTHKGEIQTFVVMDAAYFKKPITERISTEKLNAAMADDTLRLPTGSVAVFHHTLKQWIGRFWTHRS